MMITTSRKVKRTNLTKRRINLFMIQSNTNACVLCTKNKDIDSMALSLSGSQSLKVPIYPQYLTTAKRMSSFDTWPTSQYTLIFAEAGFYYTGHNDHVRCFYCGIGIQNWDSKDNPFVEHASRSLECQFIKDNKELYIIAIVRAKLKLQTVMIGCMIELTEFDIRILALKMKDHLKQLVPIFKNILDFVRAQGICGDSQCSLLRDVVQNWIYVKDNKEKKCSMCIVPNQAVGYCPDCPNPGFVDQLCMHYHQKIKSLRNHRVIDFRRDGTNCTIDDMVPVNLCSVHHPLRLDYYCTNCYVLECSICIKEHTKQNHNVDYVKDLFLVISSLYETKSFMEETVSNASASDSFGHGLLNEMISCFDVSFGIVDSATGDEMSIPIDTKRALENGCAGSISKMKCGAVLKKLLKFRRRLLTFLMPNERLCRSDDSTEVETVPKAVNSDAEYQLLANQNLMLVPSRCDDLTTCQHRQEWILSEHIGQITIANQSIQSAGLFLSHQQPQYSMHEEKTPEQEVSALQRDLENQINLDSYQNLHPSE